MTKTQEKKILALRKKGISIKNVAKSVGVGEHSVAKFLKEQNKNNDAKKSVEGTDESRIRFAKKHSAKHECKKCGKCNSSKQKGRDDEEKYKRAACSISLNVRIPADILDEKETAEFNEALHKVVEATKEYVCSVLAMHDWDVCGEVEEEN